MRVLVAEDHRVLADFIGRGLRNAGFAVDIAYDGRQASHLVGANRYDAVVLDRDLPVIHGDAICRQLAGGDTRILMLTAAASVGDRVRGLDLGADDYLGKPFDFGELTARLRALVRRSRPARPPVLARAGIALDPAHHVVTRDGRPVHLSPKEFGVLAELLLAEGAVVSSEELLERVWDEFANPFTNAVRVTVNTLRQKLGPPPVIATVHGVGYRL